MICMEHGFNGLILTVGGAEAQGTCANLISGLSILRS